MSTVKALLIALVTGAAGTISSPATAGERLTGTWLTEDGSTRVTFKSCGGADCGQIVWLREPIDPATGKAWEDKLNPDEALKRQPLIGLPMISELKEVSPGAWTASLYNPLDGNTYSGKLQMLDAARLQLKGCAFAGIICQTETWAKVK